MSQGARHKMSGEWGWRELRDYVVGQIEALHGEFPRDPLKESGIFKGFIKRWGAEAESIARCAFEVHGGWWKGAPISVGRFASHSDDWFAAEIAEQVRSGQPVG